MTDIAKSMVVSFYHSAAFHVANAGAGTGFVILARLR